MNLDPEVCYRIILSRDARYDGKFFTGVMTTGIYCRPICPARTPKRENVRFFACAAAAEAAGLRPCKRCRPETAPGTPAWNGTSSSVSRALRLIEEGYLDEHSLEQLASLLGIGSRHLRRLFVEHLGAPPNAIAQSRRVHFAAKLLAETNLPVTHVAFGSGFGSVRQFNTAFRKVFGEAPSVVRSSHGDVRRKGGTTLSKVPARRTVQLTLPYRSPYQWEPLLSFLRQRAIPGVEEVDDSSYRRSIAAGDEVGLLEVSQALNRAAALSVTVTGISSRRLFRIVERVRRVFDLDADPFAVAAHLAADSRLAPLVLAVPGLRIPSVWDPFEAAIRALLGQQISVVGAITMAGRLVRLAGTSMAEFGAGSIQYLFPAASAVAAADLSSLGVPKARSESIVALSREVAAGRIRFDAYSSVDSVTGALVGLRGIGPWSASYVALRGLGDPDAFPESDLGITKALTQLRYPAERTARSAAIERWRPWRGYAALYLWNSLSLGQEDMK